MRKSGRSPIFIPTALGCAAILATAVPIFAQAPASVPQQIEQIGNAIAKTQAQLQESQRQLDELRAQLAALQQQMAQSSGQPQPQSQPQPTTTAGVSTSAAAQPTPSIEEIHERQDMQQAEIATHEQTKVESESRFPVKLTGLILLTGFTNSSAVDMAATPTLALPGAGSTGASIRQTILGFDARGPHLYGAESYADLRVDFDGTASSDAYSGYYVGNSTLLRLRTAHAGLRWSKTSAWFALDRPLISPDTPTSLTAVAQPALAWSGNLWTWNLQAGVTQNVALGASHTLRLQSALIDVGDASLPPTSTADVVPPTTAEQSRWPGLQARISLLGKPAATGEDGNRVGIGGYVADHLDPIGRAYKAWAGTFDMNVHLPARLTFTTNIYRGQALGGLGGGAYKDVAYRLRTGSPGYAYRPLPDVGGWAQLKESLIPKLEFNAAFGMDNVFANQQRRYGTPGASVYQNLARNRTFTGNFIYSPSAYLLFSLEYRHLDTFQSAAPSNSVNIFALGAGYKF